MRSIFPVLALVAVIVGGCDEGGCGGDVCIKGSGKVVKQERPAKDFTAIELDSIGSLSVEQTDVDSVQVETDDNLQSVVTAVVKDGTLVLAEHGCHNCSPTKIAFTVTVKTLRRIDLPSTGSVRISKLDGPSFAADLSGTGSAKLSGRVDDLKISASGTGDCDAGDLIAKHAKAVVTGTGNVKVDATEALDADDSGTGSISYLGSPKLAQSNTGTGSIKSVAR